MSPLQMESLHCPAAPEVLQNASAIMVKRR